MQSEDVFYTRAATEIPPAPPLPQQVFTSSDGFRRPVSVSNIPVPPPPAPPLPPAGFVFRPAVATPQPQLQPPQQPQVPYETTTHSHFTYEEQSGPSEATSRATKAEVGPSTSSTTTTTTTTSPAPPASVPFMMAPATAYYSTSSPYAYPPSSIPTGPATLYNQSLHPSIPIQTSAATATMQAIPQPLSQPLAPQQQVMYAEPRVASFPPQQLFPARNLHPVSLPWQQQPQVLQNPYGQVTVLQSQPPPPSSYLAAAPSPLIASPYPLSSSAIQSPYPTSYPMTTSMTTSSTYVAPLDAIKAQIVNDMLMLYSGRISQDALRHYSHNAVMNSPLARGVDRKGIASTFGAIPKFFTVWQIQDFRADTTTSPDAIYMQYTVLYNWKMGSKKRLHQLTSYITLNLDPFGKIITHDEYWTEEGMMGMKSDVKRGGLEKMQNWISEAGGWIVNAMGAVRKGDEKMVGWNQRHSASGQGPYYY